MAAGDSSSELSNSELEYDEDSSEADEAFSWADCGSDEGEREIEFSGSDDRGGVFTGGWGSKNPSGTSAAEEVATILESESTLGEPELVIC
ncbi:hypothetical protein N7466_003992 [Penicillium verhagenii]|uniref:uncharacterized protein n=1 Tax=Penicillium verhagenii TaxID=1562060 RepID=UPI0025452E9A|nr:uncharacterized protein N7466_003992 [Penicillium verhagenii]KAJ5934445.1 hypothetical protein N7466_003992 [Penicillium verhagenii]